MELYAKCIWNFWKVFGWLLSLPYLLKKLKTFTPLPLEMTVFACIRLNTLNKKSLTVNCVWFYFSLVYFLNCYQLYGWIHSNRSFFLRVSPSMCSGLSAKLGWVAACKASDFNLGIKTNWPFCCSLAPFVSPSSGKPWQETINTRLEAVWQSFYLRKCNWGDSDQVLDCPQHSTHSGCVGNNNKLWMLFLKEKEF